MRGATPALFPAALALLLGAAANTDAAAVPPDFLCPSLHVSGPAKTPISPPPQQQRRVRRRRQEPSSASSSISGANTEKGKHRRLSPSSKNIVPIKYEQLEDGHWKVATAWSLHGQTYTCNRVEIPSTSIIPPSQPAETPTTTFAPVEETDDPMVADAVSAPDLPTGWAPDTKKKDIFTTPIVVLSALILATLLFLLVFTCVVWRRRVRKTRKKSARAKEREIRDGDIEHEAGAAGDAMPTIATLVEGHEKVAERARKQRNAWIKRWRSNARTSFRRRRNPPGSGQNNPSRSTVNLVLHPRSSSPPLSRPSSPLPPPLATSSSSRSSSSHPPTSTITRPDSTISAHAHPPAYAGSCVDLNDIEPADIEEGSSTRRAEAHVATDDKAVLAHLHALASAAPLVLPQDSHASGVDPDAPVWVDEDIPESEDPHQEASTSGKASTFPAPPPQSTSTYDVTTFLLDAAYVEPRGGSAPPFPSETPSSSLHPSAPSTHTNVSEVRKGKMSASSWPATPSAPPLEDDPLSAHASAPSFDEDSAHCFDARDLTPSAPPLRDEEVGEPHSPPHLLVIPPQYEP